MVGLQGMWIITAPIRLIAVSIVTKTPIMEAQTPPRARFPRLRRGVARTHQATPACTTPAGVARTARPRQAAGSAEQRPAAAPGRVASQQRGGAVPSLWLRSGRGCRRRARREDRQRGCDVHPLAGGLRCRLPGIQQEAPLAWDCALHSLWGRVLEARGAARGGCAGAQGGGVVGCAWLSWNMCRGGRIEPRRLSGSAAAVRRSAATACTTAKVQCPKWAEA